MFNHQEVRLGKLAPKVDLRTPALENYVDTTVLPPFPPRVVRSQLVKNWGMLANDTYGDCTCAAAGHAIQITSAAVSNGATVHNPLDNDILGAYWATGVPPNQPSQPGGYTDNGRSELDVLNYWRQNGIAGSKLEAYVSVRPASPKWSQTKYAIDLFGFIYIGVALPLSAQQQPIWTVTSGPDAQPGSWGGHAIIVVDYNYKGLTCVTWGQTHKMTWGWYRKYTDEAYACILPDWFNAQGQDPLGLDITGLQADLAAITSA